MTTSQEQWLNPTEFANRYNRSRPLDKDFMPLDPSFVKLLCEQGKLEHSVLPSHDGRKKDVYKIPENQLEVIDILLNDESKDPKPENGILVSEEKLMNSFEVAKFLSLDPRYVCNLVKNGKIKANKVHRKGGGHGMYMFKEEDVLAYAEKREKRKHHKEKDAEPDHRDEDIIRLKDYISKLEAEIKSLKDAKTVAELENKDLRRDNAALAEVIGASSDLVEPNPAAYDDIFEAYRRGFKDGFEMGGAH